MPTDPVRTRAIEILTAVEGGGFLDHALDACDARGTAFEVGSAERARLHYLTAGTTKFQLRLDRELDHRLERGIGSLPPAVRAVLRLSLFELRFSAVPPYAAVSTAVDLARGAGFAGLAGLVNAVLRAAGREGEPPPPADERDRLAVITSHPRWLLDEIVTAYGFEASAAYAEWNNRPPEVWVRVNLARTSLERERAELAAAGIEAREAGPLPGWLRCGPGTVPARLPGLTDGRLTVQDPSAGLAVLAAEPPSGGRIADLCAAPGGKCTYLAERGAGGTVVVATDADPGRWAGLERVVRTHGALGLERREWKEVLAEREAFDVVLVDAPCTNSGVLRRRADARWRITPASARRLTAIQLELLDRAAELLRPAGVLIYSTCSVLPIENEGVVERFLSHHPAFIPEAFPPSFPEGFDHGRGLALSRPWRHELDGAFTARLKRAG